MSQEGPMDQFGRFVATLHQLLGHDKTAAFLEQAAGDKDACLICRYERHPDNSNRQAVVSALSRPGMTRVWIDIDDRDRWEFTENFDGPVEVDDATLARWRKVLTDYQALQGELQALELGRPL